MANFNDRPVRDDGLAPPEVPFRAGGKRQGDRATRKNELLDAGPGTGYVPGHEFSGPRSSKNAGHVHEAPQSSGRLPGSDAEFGGVTRKPMPREIPVHRTPGPGGAGHFVRYLDGHSELHRDRPGLVELMHDPDTHPDDKEALHAEITHRDAVNNHRYW